MKKRKEIPPELQLNVMGMAMGGSATRAIAEAMSKLKDDECFIITITKTKIHMAKGVMT